MRQYAFNPKHEDPRITAQDEWAQLRDELNLTRDSLERSDAECVSQAALIDMLRKELADTKAQHERDQQALTVMRTKLKAAGGLVLDALKEGPAEPVDRPMAPGVSTHPTPEPGPAALLDVPDHDDAARDVVRSIHRLANKWP